MKKVLAAALLSVLFGCSSEEPRAFQQPNWKTEDIIAAPGVKPIKVQDDADAKGRMEKRYLYRPDDKPGFQIELDGDRQVEQAVVFFAQFKEKGFESENEISRQMAKKTFALLTGGDGREVDEAVEKAARGENGYEQTVGNVKVRVVLAGPLISLTAQRPINAKGG